MKVYKCIPPIAGKVLHKDCHTKYEGNEHNEWEYIQKFSLNY